MAEAGKYVGPDDIREYVEFISAEYSPYISASHFLRADNYFSGYDAQNDVCSFRQMTLIDYALEPQISSKQFRLTILFQLNFDRKKGVIEKLNGFLDAAYLNFLYGELASTDYVVYSLETSHRWRLGLGPQFILINDSFDTIGATPIKWEPS